MLVESPGQGNLLALLGTSGLSELNGDVSPLTAMIRPPACDAPMLTMSVSPTTSLDTLAFFESSV